MIIGNKCDLKDEDERKVSTEEGQMMAQRCRIPFIETSAKMNVNITKAFYDMAEMILEKPPVETPDVALTANIHLTSPKISKYKNDKASSGKCC